MAGRLAWLVSHAVRRENRRDAQPLALSARLKCIFMAFNLQ